MSPSPSLSIRYGPFSPTKAATSSPPIRKTSADTVVPSASVIGRTSLCSVKSPTRSTKPGMLNVASVKLTVSVGPAGVMASSSDAPARSIWADIVAG